MATDDFAGYKPKWQPTKEVYTAYKKREVELCRQNLVMIGGWYIRAGKVGVIGQFVLHSEQTISEALK